MAQQLSTVVDFVVLEQGQASQDTQLGVIADVKAELMAAVQPALDLVNSTQAVLLQDDQAIADAQAAYDVVVAAAQGVLDAALAKKEQDQIIADSAIVMYDFAATDLNKWIAAEEDILDDAAKVATMKEIYLRNGGQI